MDSPPQHGMKLIIIGSIIVVIALLIVGGIALRGGAGFDFGDAPATYAEAKAQDINKVWLGDGVDKEKSAKLVNADDFDDGVDIDWSAAGKSTAYFAVHKKEGIKGTAYLNLFVDFDKNGSWSGDEWVVKNMAVDLGAQDKEVAPYTAEFNALAGGRDDLWYRITISYEQKALADNGGGVFKAGEIEDYNTRALASTVPPYKFFCDPDVLKLNHGEGGTIGVSGFGFVSLANSVIPKNGERTITVIPGGVKGTSAIYFKSTHVHKRDPQMELELVPIRVDIQGAPGVKLLSRIKYCPVAVKHDPLEPMRPVVGGGETTVPPKTTTSGAAAPLIPESGLKKSPSFDTFYKKETTGNTTNFSVTVFPQDLAGKLISGLTVVYTGRNYQLPVPTGGNVSVNGSGYAKSDWQCGVSGSEWRCFGKTPLEAGKPTVLSLDFNSAVNAPAYIVVGLIDSAGKPAGTVGAKLK